MGQLTLHVEGTSLGLGHSPINDDVMIEIILLYEPKTEVQF